MKNKLTDLNNYLFEQLDRLNECDLGDTTKLKAEVDRSRAVAGIADKIIGNASVVLDAVKLENENSADRTRVPKMLTGENDAGLVK